MMKIIYHRLSHQPELQILSLMKIKEIVNHIPWIPNDEQTSTIGQPFNSDKEEKQNSTLFFLF